jgi:RNA polymerase sigma-70 factor, ECF subfamily
VALSEIDRNLLARCLDRKPRAWEDFVDRFMGLVVHVIDHSAESRSMRLTSADREDVASEVFLALVADDLAVLRRFRGEASLATYLTVITRRVVVQQLLRRKQSAAYAVDGAGMSQSYVSSATSNGSTAAQAVQDRDEIARLLEELEGTEAEIVRMYHLEGKSYREISAAVGMPENSIGPTLTRARDKMRRTSVE